VSADLLAVTAAAATDAIAPDAPPREAADHGASHDDHEAAWLRALAEMERAADRTDDLLLVAGAQGVAADGDGTRDDGAAVEAVLAGAWRPPLGLGALPADLAPRAAALVERQRELLRRTAEQLDEHRRRLRTSDGLRTRAATAAVYLDVEG
jgi:hypothetical protein